MRADRVFFFSAVVKARGARFAFLLGPPLPPASTIHHRPTLAAAPATKLIFGNADSSHPLKFHKLAGFLGQRFPHRIDLHVNNGRRPGQPILIDLCEIVG